MSALDDKPDLSGNFPEQDRWDDGSPWAENDDLEGICEYVDHQRIAYIDTPLVSALNGRRRWVCITFIAYKMIERAGGLPHTYDMSEFSDPRDTVNPDLSTFMRFAYRGCDLELKAMKHEQVRRITALDYVLSVRFKTEEWSKEHLPWLINYVTEKKFSNIIADFVAHHSKKPTTAPLPPSPVAPILPAPEPDATRDVAEPIMLPSPEPVVVPDTNAESSADDASGDEPTDEPEPDTDETLTIVAGDGIPLVQSYGDFVAEICDYLRKGYKVAFHPPGETAQLCHTCRQAQDA